jgi:hypothetical protein
MPRAARNLCRHKLAVCEQCLVVTDVGKRMADGVNGMLSFHNPWELRMRFAAVRLSDGSVSSDVYDTMEDARRINENSPDKHAFFAFRNFMSGLKPADAEIFIQVHRMMPDNIRAGDPDKGRSELIMPIAATDIMKRMQIGGGLERLMRN